jgi:hypothetical protein
MSIKFPMALLCPLLLLGGCAELDALTSTSGPRPDKSSTADVAASADKLYINPNAPAEAAVLRDVYIAPANLANMQVIQPEGASADAEWWVTDEEGEILQRAIAYELSAALSYKSAFNVVQSRQQAQIVINTAVVAVHPNETRASRAREGMPGGAITVSTAVVDAANNAVLLRSVDTRASEHIWAFNEVRSEDPAINSVFHTWGADIRRGLLRLQGRPDDPLPPAAQ